MSSVDTIWDKRMTTGLSMLELSDLPAPWRAIIRLLMRDQPQTYAMLAAALAELPEQQRLNSAQLDSALAELCRQGYLVQQAADGDRLYRTQIARKSGRTLSSNLWNALEPEDAGANEPPAKPAESPANRAPRKNLWDSLG